LAVAVPGVWHDPDRNQSIDVVLEVLKPGIEQVLDEELAAPAGPYSDPALSPDGTTLAMADFEMNAADIWLLNVDTGSRTRMTFDDATNELLPRRSPDGREIAYAATTASTFERIGANDTIHFIAADGSGATREPIASAYPTFDREWNYVAFVRSDEKTGRDIVYQPLDASSEPKALLQGPAYEEHPALTPDGRLLAYTSNESGVQQVYLTRFPSGQGKWQVSTESGVIPVWSSDGNRLYYIGPQVTVFEVAVTTEPRLMLGEPRPVVDGPKLGVDPYVGYCPDRTGNSLIVVQSRNKGGTLAIGVIENWYEEFRGRTGR